MGYPELKRESRSEGDLTSCHTDATDNNTRPVKPSRLGNVNTKSNFNPMNLTSQQPQRAYRSPEETYPLWRNGQSLLNKNPAEQRDGNKYLGFQSDASKSQNSYASAKPSYCTKYNHDKDRHFVVDSQLADVKAMPLRTQSNGFQTLQGSITNPLPSDRGNGLSHHLEHDGSSFV